MGEQGIDHTLAVTVELAHLGTGVTLGDDGQVDAPGDVRRSVEGTLGGHVVAAAGPVGSLALGREGLAFPDIMVGDAVVTQLADEDVGRVHPMRETGHHLAMEVGEGDGDVDALLGHGHVVTRGEGFADPGRLLGSQPLLEERREGVDKQHLARDRVLELYLPVALEGDIGQAAPAPGPLRGDAHLPEIDLLGIVVARKHIVEAQRAAVEAAVKLLRESSGSNHRQSKQKNKLFHFNP